MDLLWGVDLGGTKIETVAIDSSKPETPLVRKRVPTQAELGYEHILLSIASLVYHAAWEIGASRPKCVGIGTPGAIEPSTGLLKNSNTTCLIGKPLHDDLRKALDCDVRLSNDANCFALAEATYGAGKGYTTVFGVIMGTGVGGGIVVDSKVLSGSNGIAGEWGHIILHTGGTDCYCGQKGCVETYLSGPTVERRHFERTGEKKPLKEIAERAEACLECKATIDEMCENFGLGLSYIVNTLDPDAIILGGGAAQTPQLRTLGVEKLKSYAFTKNFNTAILPPTLGDSAGVFGAAMLCR